MINEEILKERERCKVIIERKIEGIIKSREKKIKSRKRRAISVFNRLLNDILFLIDNPDYVRKKDRVFSTS